MLLEKTFGKICVKRYPRVLVNMCFNLGGTRLGKFKNMLNAVEDHDWERKLLKWKTVVGSNK